MKLDLKELLNKLTDNIRTIKVYNGTSDGNGLVAIPSSMMQGDKPMLILYGTGGYLSFPYLSGNYAYCRLTDYAGNALRNTSCDIYYI